MNSAIPASLMIHSRVAHWPRIRQTEPPPFRVCRRRDRGLRARQVVARDLLRRDQVVRIDDVGARSDGSVMASLEVRWILPGTVPHAVETWLGPFAAPSEHREDRYLQQGSATLGIKVKDRRLLDVKVFQGREGRLVGVPAGQIERWQRWSFPIESGHPPIPRDAGWLPVEKLRRRRWFSWIDGRAMEVATPDAADGGMELTDIAIGPQRWWTVAFETKGDDAEMSGLLQGAVRLVFAPPPPLTAAALLSAPTTSYPRLLLELG